MGVTVRPFAAVRPKSELASAVAALPYDVMNTEEAREMAAGNPYSFLRVDKAEIDLPPATDPYDAAVYAKAGENLQELISRAMMRDDKPCFYIYRLTGYGQVQTGLAACVSAAEYEAGIIKRHEFTRPDKELDRINHMLACEAHTGPIFLAYRDPSTPSEGHHRLQECEALSSVTKPDNECEGATGDASPKAIMAEWAEKQATYDFTAEDGVRHQLWVVDDAVVIAALAGAFKNIPALYIADGHHRNATAAIVAKQRNEAAANANPDAEHNFYLAVIFPHDELAILDYNRVVKDLNGADATVFLTALEAEWHVEKRDEAVKPAQKFEVGMYLANAVEGSDAGIETGLGVWYRLTLKKPPNSSDPIENLDCSILQNKLLDPLLGIHDPRADKRIDFVGGIRGLTELEKRVNSGEMAVAFALFPTSMDELMGVADANQIMPPKSTWFEPKLRSGLLVHEF